MLGLSAVRRLACGTFETDVCCGVSAMYRFFMYLSGSALSLASIPLSTTLYCTLDLALSPYACAPHNETC